MKSLHLTLSSKTHKWLLLPFIFLTLFSSSAWGEEVTFTKTDINVSNTSATKAPITVSIGGSVAISGEQFRFSNAMTVSSSGGNITKIDVKTNSSETYISPLGNTVSSGTWTKATNTNYYWSGNATTIILTPSSAIRITEVTVTYTTSGGEGGDGDEVCDELDRAFTGITGSTYTAWSGKSGSSSDAVYAGKSAGGNSSIQLRTSGSDEGIVTTTSGGKAKSVTVTWNSNTADGRSIDIYGKNTAYSSAADLYNGSTQGTKIGSIAKGSTSLNITSDYSFIGIRSNNNALYLTDITICWEDGGSSGSGYSITYECNDATSGCPSNASGQTALPNPLPTPTKTNYSFDGWYDNSSFTGSPVTAGATLSGNITLYAKWTCSAKLTVNLNTPTHGTYVVHQGNNASGPVVSDGDVLDNCSSQSLYIVFSPDDGYGVTGFTVTGNGVQDPATAYITDHVRCDYSAGTKTTNITVTFGKACATPTISFTPTAVTKYWGDGKFTLAPTITGNDLEAELTFSSNKESCATVDANTGEVTIVNATGNGAPVTITATLAAASDGDDCQKSVSASYTLTIYNKVTWLVNGEETNAGSPTTFTTAGGKITAIPTAPDGDAVCGGKTFVGWTTSAYSGDVAPTPLYTSLSDFSSLFVNENLTFYAVFAEGSGGGGGGGTPVTESATISYSPFSFSGTGWATTATTGYSGDYLKFDDDGENVTFVSPGGTISEIQFTYKLQSSTACTGHNKTAWWIGDIELYGSINGGSSWTKIAAKSESIDRGTSLGSDISRNYTDLASGGYNAIKIQLSKTCGNLAVKGLSATYTSGGGVSYSDYSTTCGNCLAAPQATVVTRTNMATITWSPVDGATGYNVTCSGGTVTVSGTTATITGLSSETDYTYTIQSVGPNPPYDCFPIKNGEFTTPSATIDVVEWQTNTAVIYVDKEDGVDPLVIIDGEVEKGSISSVAKDLFFSKYFEGAGEMKLVAIFNGTGKDISLADYNMYTKNAPQPASLDDDDLADLEFDGTYTYEISTLGTIKNGQEIIFFTRPNSGTGLDDCSKTFLNDMSTNHSGANDNPRWIECKGGSGFPLMKFNGNDAVCLEKNSSLIDVIGALGKPGIVQNCAERANDIGWAGSVKNMDKGKSPSDPAFDKLYEASSKSPSTTADSIALLNAFGVDLSNDNISLTTARCIIFRNSSVMSGENAVANNTGNLFNTFTPTEWTGRVVCMSKDDKTAAGVANDNQATCNSYQDLGEMDYNQYRTEYTNISDDQYLDDYSHDAATGEYSIPIPNLANYACLKLRFQLKDGDDILTETAVQVPIIVSGNKNTADPIFSEIVVDKSTHVVQYETSRLRCQTCDVVVLDEAVLTKATDGTTHDVPQVRDLKVYPGGKIVVPNSTNYTVNSLAFRRQEDEVSIAELKGNLTIGATKGVSLDLRIDPTNWHYVALPYDCNVNDITFSDGEPAELGTDYFIARYDGAYRAEHKDGGWTDVTAGSTLSKGLGYIVSLPGTGSVRKELRFPMANGVITDEKASSKSTGAVYGHGCNLSDEDLTPNHKGWNLIGNPYMMYYSADLGSPLDVGTLNGPNEQGTYTRTGSARYLVSPKNNGWSGYEQVTITTHMPPFTAYFVQIGGSNPATAQYVTFNKSNANQNSIVRRRDVVAEAEDMHPIWYGIEMVAPNGEKDNTALLISDEFTDGYDMMDDLVKMRGSYYQYYNLPVLATRNSQEELAFNALPDNSAEVIGVPVNYYAAQAGEYTISTDGRYDLSEVKEAKLFDATTNQYYDLLTDNYTFTANKGNNTDRFRLFVTVERNKVPTATESPTLADVAITTFDKTLVLSGLNDAADIFVYDMSGKLIRSDQANGGGAIWRTVVPATGVYFVRVNTANGQQTLRAIVK